MNISDVRSILSSGMGSLYSLLTSDQVDKAVGIALMELGWTLPVDDTDKDRCFWVISRAKRHAMDVIRTESAYKFDYKQVKLSNRFDQLNALIIEFDKQFEEAIQSMPSLFTTLNTSTMFGSYISPGFSTSSVGRDTTYTDENEVQVFGVGD